MASKICLKCVLVAAGLAAAGPACKSSTTSPSPATSSATITITSSGVSPKSVTVSPGSQVTFTNSDSRQHEMASDPHPEHTDCPAINSVGTLSPGQSRSTGNLNVTRTCGFHDHLRSEDQSLRGTITIQ